MRRKSLDWLCSDSQAPAVLDRAAGAQRDFNPRLIVPTHIGIQGSDELLDGGGQPVVRVEELVLQAAEETFARCVVLDLTRSRGHLIVTLGLPPERMTTPG